MKNKKLATFVIVTFILLTVCIFTNVSNVFTALFGWAFSISFIIALVKFYKLGNKPLVKIKNQTVVQLLVLSGVLNAVSSSLIGRSFFIEVIFSILMIAFSVIVMIRLYGAEIK